MEDIKRIIATSIDQVWRRRWLALGFAWTVCVIGWIAVAMMPDRYQSEARFYVDTQSLLTPLLKGISVNADDKSRDQEVAIMQRTLTSRPNLTRIAQMTDLDKSVNSPTAMQALITGLESRIVIQSQGTNLFAVTYSDNSPETAKNVVQALLTIFVESSTGNKREDIQTARAFIESQISDYEGQLKAAEQRLADFKVKNVGFFSSSSQTFAMRLEQARENIETLRLEYGDAAAQRDQARQQVAQTPQFLAVDSVSPYAGGGERSSPLQQRIQTLQSKLDELKLQYTPKHPEVVRTQEALNALLVEQRRINGGPGKMTDDEIASGKAQIPNELHSQLSLRMAEAETRAASAKRKLDDAQSMFGELQKKASEAPRIEAEFTNLNRDYEVLKASYEGLLQRRESARIAAAADSTTEPVQFRLIAAPEIPAQPAGPMRLLFNSLVFLLGLGAGVGFVILLGRIEDRVSTPEDLYDLGDYPVLGSVSTVVTEARRLAALHDIKRFGAALAGLAMVFLVMLAASPNFSSILRKMGA
jgi:polysaccharide chain length determinant protein (PEP-CTERM system associated)